MTLKMFGDLVLMMMILGAGVMFVWINSNYLPGGDDDENR